jgi:hypothetical protein
MGKATELTVAGQIVVVQGAREDIAAVCKQRKLTADDGMRELRTIDGETVTFNIAAVALIRAAVEKRKGAFGFAQALEAAA